MFKRINAYLANASNRRQSVRLARDPDVVTIHLDPAAYVALLRIAEAAHHRNCDAMNCATDTLEDRLRVSTLLHSALSAGVKSAHTPAMQRVNAIQLQQTER